MWITRDKDGELLLWHKKPVRRQIAWYSPEHLDFGCWLDSNEYLNLKDLKFEDEPIEVELVVKKKITLNDLQRMVDNMPDDNRKWRR